MNRHMRRAAGKNQTSISKTVEGIRELAGVAETLRPYLAQIDALQDRLKSTTALFSAIQEENRALQTALADQRAIYLELFARGMGVPLDAVLSLEAEIKAKNQSGQDAIETHQIDAPAATQNSGA